MKKSISTLLFYFISVSLFSQKVYTPDWESLDKRPVPSWFEDAKFVILPVRKSMIFIQPCMAGISLMPILLPCSRR